MKKLQWVLLVLMVSSNYSCWDDTHNDPIVGSWELIEARVDPGNGTGTWTKPTGPEVATFQNDGSAALGSYLNGEFFTRYEIIKPDSLKMISSDGKYWIKYVYRIKDNELYLNGMCYEGCEYKYRKIFKLPR